MSDLAADARLALACLDLTSLNDDDDNAAIDRLCARALGPAGRGWPASVCVWPRFVAQARAALPAQIRVAAVANFPSGALDTEGALRDTAAILGGGGDEVDLVLPWRALRSGAKADVAALVCAVRKACAGHMLKLIIESGELGGDALIDAACAIGLDAGVDFLKTSTGKTPLSASTAAAERMLRAIAAHPRRDAIGFKASGGIRTVSDAAVYMGLTRSILGDAALTSRRLRLGASGLLGDIEAVLEGRTQPPRRAAEY